MKYTLYSYIFLILAFCFLSSIVESERKPRLVEGLVDGLVEGLVDGLVENQKTMVYIIHEKHTITIQFQKDTIPPKPVCDSVKHIIIGDSQTPFVDNQSTKVNRVSTTSGMSSLWQGGKSLSWLVQALESYKVDSCVVSVVFCIGTNGGYSSKDNVDKLVSLTLQKFPNSKLYAVQGSWGWGGIKDVTETKVRTYYKRFEKLGVTIIEPPIGRIEPHGNKPIYKTIGKNIDILIN